MKRFFVSVVLALMFLLEGYSCVKSQGNEDRFVISNDFTPVLNTPDFESVFGGTYGNQVKVDNQGLIREMEFIAFPGTIFRVLSSHQKDGYEILEVKTNDYVYDTDLFIDSRFTDAYDNNIPPAEKKRVMPAKDEILSKMRSLEGYPYMWGGNFADGIEKMLNYYKPATEIDSLERNLWIMKGVDCSGLIYESTGGITPRNTSSLTVYGRGLEIAGKSTDDIASMLEPLDLIVWSGHVVIVFSKDEVIESSPGPGVHKSPLNQRLAEIINERTPVNDWGSTKGKRFVIRRWIDVENP